MPPTIEKQSPRLAELQQWLRWIFTEPRGIDAALEGSANILRQPEPTPRLLNWITDGPPISVRQRIAVYADAYFVRLLDAMGSDFKTVRNAVGDESFRQLIADYLQAHPSISPNIGDLGEAFPAFVGSHALNQNLPFLSDLATLEWTFLACLHADRMPPLDPASLRSIKPEDWSHAKLILDPTVHLLDLQWPVHKLWKRRDHPASQGPRQLAKPRPQQLLLFRNDDWVNVRPIGPMEFSILNELGNGQTLGQACETMQEAYPAAGAGAVQAWFADWTASGVVKRVEFPQNG